MLRQADERFPFLCEPLRREPSRRNHSVRTLTMSRNGRAAHRPVRFVPGVSRAAAPHRRSRWEWRRAVHRVARRRCDESKPRRVRCGRMDQHSIEPVKHQRFRVDDAAVRCPVLHDERPRCAAVEVLPKVRVRTLRSGYGVGAANEDQLRNRCCRRRQLDRVNAERIEVAWIAGDHCRYALGCVTGEPRDQRTRSREPQQNQLAGCEFMVVRCGGELLKRGDSPSTRSPRRRDSVR